MTAKRSEWRPIPGFEHYEVSDRGAVRSYKNNRHGISPEPKLLKPWRHSSGYLKVVLCAGQQKKFYVHALVLLAFVGPRPEGMDCCHNNDIKTDNRLENLRWDTRSENNLDKGRNRR